MSAGPFDQQLLDESSTTAELEPEETVEPQPESPSEPSAEAEVEEPAEPAPAWIGGGFAAYEVGDPGRAAREVVAPPAQNPSDPADTVIDGAVAGPLTIRAASVRGISHRYEGTPRQDDYAVCATEDGDWLVVAVADGVSAGSMSHQAATIACRAAGALIRDALAAGTIASIAWDDVVGGIAKRILAHGKRVLNDTSPEEISAIEVARTMATTLVMAVLPTTPTDEGHHEGVLVAIGDTSGFVLGTDRSWRPVTEVKNDGATVASSATVALPYLPSEPLTPRPFGLAPGEALLVMTDGVGDPLGRGDGDVGRFLGEEWATPPDLVSFAGQVGFARRSYDDDRTTVGIWVAP